MNYRYNCGDEVIRVGVWNDDSNIGKQLNKKVRTISPTRAQLINKGIIFSVRHSELDFTVPEFDNYIRRLDEYQQWNVDGDEYDDE